MWLYRALGFVATDFCLTTVISGGSLSTNTQSFGGHQLHVNEADQNQSYSDKEPNNGAIGMTEQKHYWCAICLCPIELAWWETTPPFSIQDIGHICLGCHTADQVENAEVA